MAEFTIYSAGPEAMIPTGSLSTLTENEEGKWHSCNDAD